MIVVIGDEEVANKSIALRDRRKKRTIKYDKDDLCLC